jgi:hypothetical protein
MTPEEKHYQKYEGMCQKYHVAWEVSSPRLVGETLESLILAYQQDKYFNTIPLRNWDSLAYGFLAFNPRSGLSLAEAVCMQKHAAEKLVLETLERRESVLPKVQESSVP